MHRLGQVVQWILPCAGRGMTWNRSESICKLNVNPDSVSILHLGLVLKLNTSGIYN